jgi:hypothetical protein
VGSSSVLGFVVKTRVPTASAEYQTPSRRVLQPCSQLAVMKWLSVYLCALLIVLWSYRWACSELEFQSDFLVTETVQSVMTWVCWCIGFPLCGDAEWLPNALTYSSLSQFASVALIPVIINYWGSGSCLSGEFGVIMRLISGGGLLYRVVNSLKTEFFLNII